MSKPIMPNKIGVIVDSFRVGVREGLVKAKNVGADGVQIYAVHGEMDPANLSASARKELKDYIESLGLEISALVGDLGATVSRIRPKMQPKSRSRNASWSWVLSSAPIS